VPREEGQPFAFASKDPTRLDTDKGVRKNVGKSTGEDFEREGHRPGEKENTSVERRPGNSTLRKKRSKKGENILLRDARVGSVSEVPFLGEKELSLLTKDLN